MRMPGAVIWDQDIRDQVRRTEASGHNVSGVWAVMGSIWNVRGQDPTPAMSISRNPGIYARFRAVFEQLSRLTQDMCLMPH